MLAGMGIIIRTARDDEREEVQNIAQLAFAVRPRPYDEADDRAAGPLDRRLIAVDEDAAGRIVGSFKVWEMGQWFGGRRVPSGGVSMVAVHPAYRGRGIGSRLAAAGLTAMRDRGEAIATLYPMNHTFYRRFGWEVAGGFPHLEADLRAVADLPAPSRATTTRPTAPDDLPALRALHERLGAAEPGNLSYGDDLALRRLLGHDGIQEGYVAESGGEVTGVVVLAHAEKSVDSEFYSLDVRNLIAADLDAELALWRLVADHYPVARTVRFTAAQHLAAPTMLGERCVRASGPGWAWMTRLVDAGAAVAARGYGAEVSGEVALDVVDEKAPWNAGPHVLRVKGGTGVLEPGGSGAVRMPVGTLASLYTGWAEPRTMARLGRVSGASERDLDALTAIFSGRTPWSRDFF